MLLYVQGKFINQIGGRFIQVLEGEETKVREAYDRIKQDPRHHSITLSNESSVKQRNFTSWSMGIKSMTMEEYQSMPGYFELNERFLKPGNSKTINVPLTFLKSFYSMNLTDHY